MSSTSSVIGSWKQNIVDNEVFVTQNMSSPARPSEQYKLSQWRGDFTPWADCLIWNVVLPPDSQYCPKASRLKYVRLITYREFRTHIDVTRWCVIANFLRGVCRWKNFKNLSIFSRNVDKSVVPCFFWLTVYNVVSKKVKTCIALNRIRATERHLPYGITQCYLPPDTGERAPP